MQVLNQTKYVEQRRKILLDHCREGREKNQWVYTEGVVVENVPVATSSSRVSRDK